MRDYGIGNQSPKHMVAVQGVADVRDVLRGASSSRDAVVPWGGGTHQGMGDRLTRYDVALDLTGLKGVLAYRPEELTLTAQAGVTLAEVREIAQHHGQWLPLDVEYPERCTLGGAIATGAAGPWRMRYGTARDAILWCEVIKSDGVRIEGGAQVVKNVAGYDLPRLFTGSLGALGVITAVCVRLQPRPAHIQVLALGFLEADNTRDIVDTLLTGTLEPAVLTLVKGDAAWGEPFGVGPWVLLVGFAGPRAATAWQCEQVLAIARHAGMVASDAYEQDDASLILQRVVRSRQSGPVILKLMVRPGDVPALADWITQMPHTQPAGILAEVGAGVVRAIWQSGSLDVISTGVRDVRQMACDLGGNWMLETCPDADKVDWGSTWGEPQPSHMLMRQLKMQFDPERILNPGRTVGG